MRRPTPRRRTPLTDPFKALGLSSDATVTQVRAAWRLKVARPGVHPDLGGDRESFDALREAYEVALRIAENSPCEACRGTGNVGMGGTVFAKMLMRCTACGGTGKRERSNAL